MPLGRPVVGAERSDAAPGGEPAADSESVVSYGSSSDLISQSRRVSVACESLSSCCDPTWYRITRTRIAGCTRSSFETRARFTSRAAPHPSWSKPSPSANRPSPVTKAAALLPRLFGTKVPGHTTRAPSVGFELATNGIQLYAIANLDKTCPP